MPRLSPAIFRSSRSGAVVLGIAAALLLSGCQGGSTPVGSSSETSSTTASPTLSVSTTTASATLVPTAPAVYKPADAKGKAQNVPVPVMPELAKENSKTGLEAFIGYWYATYSYATETGDLTAWSRSTDTTTVSGKAYQRAIESNYVKDRWVVGGRITTPVIDVLWNDGMEAQAAKVQVIQEDIEYFDADGSPGQGATAATNTAEAVMVAYRNGAWQVIDNGLILG